MRYSFILVSLLVLIPLCGCERMEYDTLDLNKEVTLFQEGVSLPLGNVGPVTVGSILQGSSMGSVVSQFVKEDSDGLFYVESEEELLNLNAYEIALKVPDQTQPYHWEVGTKSASVSSMASVLGMFGFGFPHQMLIVQARNPLKASVGLNTTARIECMASDYSTSYSQEESLADYSMPSYYSSRTIAQFALPEDKTDRIASVELVDMALDLPENMAEKVRSGSNSSFVFSYKYKGQLAAKSDFSMSQLSIPINGLKVEIGKFKLRQCQATFDLESSLPFDVTLDKVKILGQDGQENPDIVVSPGVKIAGGTLDAPAVTPVTLEIKAQEGYIPDITGVEIVLTIKASDGMGNIPLSSKMALSVKSASVTLRGGITLFGNEK